MTRVNHEARCPACKKTIDGATAVIARTQTPKPGDVTVCAYCQNVMRFQTDLTVRTMTLDELDQLSPFVQQLLIRAQALLRTRALLRERSE